MVLFDYYLDIMRSHKDFRSSLIGALYLMHSACDIIERHINNKDYIPTQKDMDLFDEIENLFDRAHISTKSMRRALKKRLIEKED